MTWLTWNARFQLQPLIERPCIERPPEVGAPSGGALERSHPRATGRSDAPVTVGQRQLNARLAQRDDATTEPGPGQAGAVDARARPQAFDEAIKCRGRDVEVVPQ